MIPEPHPFGSCMFPEYCRPCTAELRRQFQAAISGIENAWRIPFINWRIPFIKMTFIISDSKCECGAEKCGSNFHSTWCPKKI